MVALAILSAALMGISEIVSGALRNHGRARDLDVATLLARGKMVDLEEKYRLEPFPIADEEEDGTFEDDGHPEVRWKAELVAPKAENLCTQLFGELLPGMDGSGSDASRSSSSSTSSSSSSGSKSGTGPQSGASPQGLAMEAVIQQQCATLSEDVKKGVRELRLTVAWGPEKQPESFTVVTHLVVLQPGATPPGGTNPNLPGGTNPNLPGGTNPNLPGGTNPNPTGSNPFGSFNRQGGLR